MTRRLGIISALVVCFCSLAFGPTPEAVAASSDGAELAPFHGVAVAGEERLLSAYVQLEARNTSERFAALNGQSKKSIEADEVARVARVYRHWLERVDAEVRQSQAAVIAHAGRLGLRVVSSYTSSANGLLVHATTHQLNQLARVPGVVSIEPAPLVRPALVHSVPHVGAQRLARELGFDGSGSVVAIIDTGIDYTHAHLGGPGTTEAWDAASAAGATETITDTWEGVPLFPTDKVIGGWDFVGPRYDPPHLCPPDEEAAGECTSTPEPDPDPLDGGSHGTHVAGIVAGNEITGIGDGMAPGAKLVALKLYGRGGGDEAADVLVDAIEWCTRVNLGLEDRGVVPERIDAINISLGEGFAQGSRLFDEAVSSAVEAGIIVVASACNSGDRAFVLGTPAASPQVLSVASSLPPVTGLEVEVTWEEHSEVHMALESAIAPPLSQTGAIEAELAWFGRGCTGDDVYQDVQERIALVERGECVFNEKLLNAQAAGAIAVLMFTDSKQKSSMGGSREGIEIPAVMIDRDPGLAMAELLSGGVVVRATLDPDREGLDMTNADHVSGFSSRGPSKNGALKPDITAPGTGIVSTRRGSGTGGVSMGGTSMSGPHVAGAAALVHHRNREEGLDLGGKELGALLMNYARPIVYTGSGTDVAPVSVVRQGAGLVDLWGAGTGRLLAVTGDIASINLGEVSLIRRERLRRSLTVTSLADEVVTFAVAAHPLGQDEDTGLGVDLPIARASLLPHSTTTVPVVFDIDPADLASWSLRPQAGADVSAVQDHEIDGFLSLTEVGSNGDPVRDAPVVTVPFYVLPRRASAVSSRGLPALGEENDELLEFENRSQFVGEVELFVAPPATDTGLDAEDPDEPDVAHELDIRRVGVRLEPPTEEVTKTMVTFALARHERAAIPQVTRYAVYIDTDLDGLPDHRVREGRRGDRMYTYVGQWDHQAGSVVGDETITDTIHATDLHTHLTMLSVPCASLGITGTMAMGAADTPSLEFYVVNTGLTEDWLFSPSLDVAPDGATTVGGPRYRFDPASLARSPETWTFSVEHQQTYGLTLERLGGMYDATLIAFYPDNRFEKPERQMQALSPGDVAPRTKYVFLPLGWRN